jgi:type II secretory pathway pseudopilin PulG
MTMTDRAVSAVVGYALMLVVIGILTSGLIVGATNFVDAKRTDVTRTQLNVIGNQLAADLTAADSLADSLSSGGSATVQSDLAEFVAGGSYRIEISSTDSGDEYAIVLRSQRDDVTQTVTVVTDHSVTTGEVRGGPLTLTVTADRLEVTDD